MSCENCKGNDCKCNECSECNGCNDCECNDCNNCEESESKSRRLNIIMFDVLMVVVFVLGYTSFRETHKLKVRLQDAIQQNIELQQMIISDEIKDIENMDVSDGMNMEKFMKFNDLYLQYFDNSHGEVYLRRIKNEEVVVLKLKEALENEKDSENQKMIKESLDAHNEILDLDKEKYDKWNNLQRDYLN